MVHNCTIISCPLHNRRNIRKGLLFHSFPVDHHRFELWRQTVFTHCSQTLSINKHSKICYRHFQPDDYIANHTGLTRYLKATAIPSVFTEINSNSNRLLEFNSSLDIPPPSFLILPSKSASPTITNTKTKRLLNTIDKLHQIQNANKVVMTQQLIMENESIKQDEDEHQIIEEQHTPKTIELINGNHLSLDNSLRTSSSFVIDPPNTPKEQQDTFQHSSLEPDTFRWTENTIVSLPKNHLEGALFKFLEQANLLQYYSAFIEQGGDDLKQLAEAQNDDFQEIITLVGMASKPLHVKRFKKALVDYQQSTNHSYSTLPLQHLSTEETSSDRQLFPSHLHPPSANNSPKIPPPISSNWCLNKIDNGKNSNIPQLLDDNQRKMIADEAERLANLLPIATIKKPNGRNQISKDLFATMNLPRDFEDRWQRIRKYSAIYNRFDSKKPDQMMSSHEILINEAAAAICFHRPEFLTRRDELLHLARRVLQNIGIFTTNTQKRPLSMLTYDITPTKQIKLNIPISKSNGRQRDPDAFRLMWRNREAKVEQIPIEIEALRCEQNKLLQQLKQSTLDPSSSFIDNNGLKNQIDDLSKKIEQLIDEEKNLRRLIRKKNMRLRAKERQQQKQQMTANHPSTIQDLMVPIIPIIPSPISLPPDIGQDQQASSLVQISENNNKNDMYHSINIKDEKMQPYVNLCSPVLKARKDFSTTTLMSKPIDRRREEVNERSMALNKKTIIHTNRSSRSTQRKQSSSTTAIELVLDCGFHSQSPTDILPTIHDDEEIVESKSFIHNLDFNISTPIGTNE